MIKKEIINQSIDYIIQHLDEDLTVEKIADHFHYSKFYFCRSFKKLTGESLYSFIKRLKMDQSAIDIKLEKHKPIMDIGMDYGYSSSNYSSAFKNHHFVSPVEFRKATSSTNTVNPFYPDELFSFDKFEAYDNKIKIQVLQGYTVIYERVIGNYIELKEKWMQFIDLYSEYVTPATLMIERFYHDPSITDLTKCICDLCMTIDENCRLDNIATIREGKFAVYRYKGKIKDIFPALQGIFNVWLPNSGYEMDKRYGLNIYRKIDIENEFVTMDLCIPIK